MNSLPNKQFEGQTGYPTPNAPPDETGCRVFIIPADEEWFALFTAAALTLTYEWAWFKNGDLTQEEAAAAWSAIIDDALARSMLGTCLLKVPTPYWDETSADDADNEMSPEDQIWYGEIVALPSFVAMDAELTFLDNIGIWAIAGFIAYAGLPGAAIAFVPLAQKFVLEFKRHSIGGVVSVLVDFLHLADIDTYGVEDGVASYTVSIPDDGMAHTVYVEMSEDSNPAAGDSPNIQVIRKRLDSDEVTPPNLRWNEDCDCVQQSPDGGATWVDSPTQDPRSSAIFQVPLRTGVDVKCNSAQQMHDRVKNMLDAIITSSDILQAINSFVAVVAVFFFEFGIVIEAIWAIVSALFSIGTTVLNAALTDAVYDQLLCIFYCEIASDGSVSQAQYDRIVFRVNHEIGGTAATALTQALASIGHVGLTNAGALGEVTGDCSACSCAWCYEWDFTLTDGGWVVVAADTFNEGVYVGGTGWQQFLHVDSCDNHAYLNIIYTLSTGNLANLENVQLYVTTTDIASGGHVIRTLDGSGSVVTAVDWSGYTTPGDTFALTGTSDSVKLALIDFQCDHATHDTLYKLRVSGHGDMPAFSGGTVCTD